MGFFSKIKEALKKTKNSLAAKLADLFSRNKLGNEFYEELEEILIASDVSVLTASEIVEEIKARAIDEKCRDKDYVIGLLKEAVYEKLTAAEPLEICLPAVIMVVGVNGVGKTTLFRLIMGIEKPLSGSFKVGETVKLAYVDQQHSSIDPEKTVYQVISQDSELIQLGGRSINARAYVSRFNFSGTDQEKKCGVLSGGERNRLHLALALKEEGNVLLLDEPTNDIDVNTLRALEEGLNNFAGCAVVISHDRWFLDRIATHILAFEGDSQVVFFEGSYSEYEENKRKRLGDDTPHRVKYRKLLA